MYKISVPVMNKNLKTAGREKTVEEIKKFDAQRVFLAIGTYETDSAKRKEIFEDLKENTAYFKSLGYEVGAWLWTFALTNNTSFTNMRSINGTEIKGAMCPSDRDFVSFAGKYISEIASCGVDLIMLDDDFRYGYLSDSPACLCDRHIAEINRITGENRSLEELKSEILRGGKNKYRDAYLKANGDAFRNFAKCMREAVDTVNPKIRLGACACLTAWDIDGTTAKELAYILAGETRPFVRLIGAPYWAVNKNWGNCLQDVIELERMESAVTADGNIEIMAEGDTYPRPRTRCPASYLEGFDTAMRASGCTDGILKYGIDYHSSADYEKGYAERHIRNREMYGKIDEFFGNKISAGVRVYESMNKVAEAQEKTKIHSSVNFEELFFSKSARMLAYNTVPTVYEGEGVTGIAFDENARYLTTESLNKGLILDISAAIILTERGIDVGLRGFECYDNGQAKAVDTDVYEHFLHNGNRIHLLGCEVYHIKVDSKAEILSDIQGAMGKIPVSYRYENGQGNRFLVLNVNSRNPYPNILYHYERSRQLSENIPWLSGEKLPAYVYGNPALYLQCKKNADAMAVGLWNFYADTAIEPEVFLDREYSSIKFINCNGKLEKDRVYLTDIEPFGFVGFEVK